ncbi:MAG: hypothetical protein ACR2NI_00650, partial [Pirellulales bacterium]
LPGTMRGVRTLGLKKQFPSSNRVQALGNWLCRTHGDFRISPMRYAAFKLLTLAMVSFSGSVSAFSEELYFPTTDRDWETVTPESLGWDVAALDFSPTAPILVRKKSKKCSQHYEFFDHRYSYYESANKNHKSNFRK